MVWMEGLNFGSASSLLCSRTLTSRFDRIAAVAVSFVF
jgi:hypothetical protein